MSDRVVQVTDRATAVDPIRITCEAIADHESCIEYWDAATGMAWVACEPNTVYHEGPGQVLSGLLTRIAAIRGAPILTLGATDLLLRNARGERQRILQADHVVFLDPVATRPRSAAVEVGSDHLPDVVLAVDYATDVRARATAERGARRCLYGFPCNGTRPLPRVRAWSRRRRARRTARDPERYRQGVSMAA